MLKTKPALDEIAILAYHLGEGRVLKTDEVVKYGTKLAYHLGEGRVLKTSAPAS